MEGIVMYLVFVPMCGGGGEWVGVGLLFRPLALRCLCWWK